MSRFPYGFWVRGGKYEPRVLVDARRALAGFAACEESARPGGEHYLSAFTYGDDFKSLLIAAGTPRGFDGPCGADWVWWDIDRENDPAAALADARALALHITDRWRVRESDLLVFPSGGKGFHAGVPAALWTPAPSVEFHRVARRFAQEIAREAGGEGVAIDTCVYDKGRLFRAPNSRHPKTGLRKRLLTLDELTGLAVDRIRDLAREPLAFDVPAPVEPNDLLAGAWAKAEAEQAAEAAAMAARRAELAARGGPDRLNALTLDFIREGAPAGGDGTAPEAGRNRRLYAAAINLGEFGCPPRLAHALLSDIAMDCGLSPGEVRRQIDNGLRDAAGKGALRG